MNLNVGDIKVIILEMLSVIPLEISPGFCLDNLKENPQELLWFL